MSEVKDYIDQSDQIDKTKDFCHKKISSVLEDLLLYLLKSFFTPKKYKLPHCNKLDVREVTKV